MSRPDVVSLYVDPKSFVERSVQYGSTEVSVTKLNQEGFLRLFEMLTTGSTEKFHSASDGSPDFQKVSRSLAYHDHLAPYQKRILLSGGSWVDIECGSIARVW